MRKPSGRSAGALAIVSCTVTVAIMAGCTTPLERRESVGSSTPSPVVSLKTTPHDGQNPSRAEAQYLVSVRASDSNLQLVSRATETQLLVAGWQACAQMKDQNRLREIVVLEGERPDARGVYQDSALIVAVAALYLCNGTN